MARRCLSDTRVSMPRSKYTRSPSSSIRRLPGCGSACMMPVRMSCVRLQFTLHGEGDEWEAWEHGDASVGREGQRDQAGIAETSRHPCPFNKHTQR